MTYKITTKLENGELIESLEAASRIMDLIQGINFESSGMVVVAGNPVRAVRRRDIAEISVDASAENLRSAADKERRQAHEEYLKKYPDKGITGSALGCTGGIL